MESLQFYICINTTKTIMNKGFIVIYNIKILKYFLNKHKKTLISES